MLNPEKIYNEFISKSAGEPPTLEGYNEVLTKAIEEELGAFTKDIQEILEISKIINERLK